MSHAPSTCAVLEKEDLKEIDYVWSSAENVLRTWIW